MYMYLTESIKTLKIWYKKIIGSVSKRKKSFNYPFSMIFHIE